MRVTTKAWRPTEADMELISSKKRKLYSELENEGYCGREVEPSPENSGSPAASGTSGGFYEHGEFSSDVVKTESSYLENVDLMSEVFGTEISTSITRVFRETTPTSEFYGDSEQVLLQSLLPKCKESTPPAISRRKIIENSPMAAEIEEFFAAAEKYHHKRFVEKYNYDIVRDVPLEGKYQWVRLHP